VFFAATSTDYIVAAVITLPLAAIGQIVGPMLGFFALFAGPIAGAVIAELVWRANGKRRGKYTWLVVAGCMILASLPVMIGPVLMSAALVGSGSGLGRAGLYGVMNLLWPVIYLILAVGSAIARLRYGK
jgi:hypothetical protein